MHLCVKDLLVTCFFGLRHTAQVNGIELPSLYKQQAYAKLNYNIISTRTLASPAVLAGSFGPVVQDGLGIGYSIQEEECGVIATTYNGKCDGKMFVDNWHHALKTIRNIVEKRS